MLKFLKHDPGLNQLVLLFDYAPAMNEELKQLVPGVRFDRSTQTWRLAASVSPAGLNLLMDFAVGHGFQIDEAARTVVAKRTQEAAAIARDSHAVDADFEVGSLGGTLLPFQRAGVAYITRVRRVLLGDEMGLGKSVQALAAIEATRAFPALIVCPATLKLNWQREAQKWLPKRESLVLTRNAVINRAAIVIVNYDILGKHIALLKSRGFQAVVFDESHYAKNHKAQRTKHCQNLADGVPVRLCLTGTPVVNRPGELISQLQLLDRLDDLGGFWGFAKRYCAAYQNHFGWDFSGASHLDELHEKLRATCFIRRTKAQVLPELPPKRRSIVTLEIENKTEYQRAERDLIGWIGAHAAEDKRFLESIAYLPVPEKLARQRERASSAAQSAARAEQLVRITALKRLAATGKIGGVKDWIESFVESKEKLVVFAHHREIQGALLEFFPSAATIRGDDDVAVRQANVDRFQNDPACQLIICSLRAAAVGLTLTAGSNVCFVELGWTPAEHDQAEARCHRLGQRESVTAWYLLADGTIESDIAALIEEKRSVINAATDGAARANSASIIDELVARLTTASPSV